MKTLFRIYFCLEHICFICFPFALPLFIYRIIIHENIPLKSYRSCLLLCFFKYIIQALSCDPIGCHCWQLWVVGCVAEFMFTYKSDCFSYQAFCSFSFSRYQMPFSSLCTLVWVYTHTLRHPPPPAMCINKDWAEVKYCDIWYLKNQSLNSRAVIKGADVWLLTNEIFYVKLLVH